MLRGRPATWESALGALGQTRRSAGERWEQQRQSRIRLEGAHGTRAGAGQWQRGEGTADVERHPC